MNSLFKFNLTNIQNVSGQSSWKSPSNIALIKYWGKKEIQILLTASLSLTFFNCFKDCGFNNKP